MRKFRFLLFAPLALIAVAAVTFITMSLWNWLVPLLFHGPVIEFWQALGLLILTRLLFGRFGHRRGCGGRWGHHHWRKRWEDKWNTMTPEQREELRKKWNTRCGPLWFDSKKEGTQASEGSST